MAFTQRKDILDSLLYYLGQIKQANGYQTDIVTVERHRDTVAAPFDPSECWAVNVKDGHAQVTHNVSDDEHALPVDLEIVTTSRISAAEVETMIADVARCLDLWGGTGDAGAAWGGHADGTAIDSHGIDVAQAGDTITSGLVSITIHYTTDKGKI